MRNLTIASLALAAAVTVSGFAHADEYLTRENKESAAIAAQSSADAARALSETHVVPALGYANSGATNPGIFNHTVTAPSAQTRAHSVQMDNADHSFDVN